MRELANKRLQKNFRKSLKYLTLVFNDFFVLALIFLFGALMFWYAQSMKTMPQGLWFYRPLVGAILWLPLLMGNLVTLIDRADLQFLLPQDEQMLEYLKPMVYYSLLLPIFMTLVIAGILFPFATIKAEISPLIYGASLLAVLAAKVLQLQLSQRNLYFGKKLNLTWLNLAFLLIFVIGMWLPISMVVVTILLLAAVVLLHAKPTATKLFDWQYAVNQENKRKNRVYAAFSMFTDVKEKRVSIKRRKYLDFLLPKSLSKENPNKFLYRRSLLRNPENLNLLVRMTMFAVLISWLVQETSWALGLACLVIFLTVYQLLPMAEEFDDNLMYRVYPIDRGKRGQDLIAVLTFGLLLQWLIVSLFWLLILPINGQLWAAIGILLVFSLCITRIYLPYKIKKRKIS
ncbi:ABC transporter permease [Lactobacillus sp. ESL0681]|uniref:ABC transporter permease n=1 Tax=Lactobacillus sp. ESL0681 TaxID=2983211 RepID=UPI0023F8630D|nr:ABC transporter permease [Lactobacillus sp. ESL0681]WEV40951.1 ABC transporter permease [Lactobacillus sp. ESL0681]